MAVTPRKSLRFEITLPRYYNSGKEISIEKFLKTKNELTERFGACTFLRPTVGDWTDDTTGKAYLNEQNTGFQVVVPKSMESEALAYFDRAKPRLKRRFKQEDIFIIFQEVTLI